MKNRNITKLLSFILSLILVLSSSSMAAYAVSLEENPIISSAECETLAEYWLDIYYDTNTVIEEIIPISNGDVISSYCVSFVDGDEPAGYIVVDSNRYAVNNVTEFSFSGKGIYDLLIDHYGEPVEVDENEKVIFSTGLFDYAIEVDKENDLYYNSTHEIMGKEEIAEQCIKTTTMRETINENAIVRNASTYSLDDDKEIYYGGFFTSGTITSTGSYTSKTITNAGSFTPTVMGDYKIEDGYSGNCTPTAAANLLSYYKEKRGFTDLGDSRQDIYDSIVSASGWDQFGDEGMSLSEAKKGMKSVVTSAGYSFSSTDYWFNPWSSWKRDLKNDYPVLTAVWGYRKDESDNWIEVGHSIVAIGYREYDSGANYLRVYDGWNETSDKYIYFNADYFTSIEGLCIKVTD